MEYYDEDENHDFLRKSAFVYLVWLGVVLIIIGIIKVLKVEATHFLF